MTEYFYSKDCNAYKRGRDSYYKRIIAILSNIPQTINEIAEKIDEEPNRQGIITAIKKGISNGTIRQIPDPQIKTQYMGHKYSLA